MLRIAAACHDLHGSPGQIVERRDVGDAFVGDEQLIDAVLLATNECHLGLALRGDGQVGDGDVAATPEQRGDELGERNDHVLYRDLHLPARAPLVELLAVLLQKLDQDTPRARALQEEVRAAR